MFGHFSIISAHILVLPVIPCIIWVGALLDLLPNFCIQYLLYSVYSIVLWWPFLAVPFIELARFVWSAEFTVQ